MKKKSISRIFPPEGHSRGQALILIAVAFVVLLAFVGLTVDVGNLFIRMGHLQRATDAAVLAAAAQFREGRYDEMEAAAKQAAKLNGVDPDEFSLIIETCQNPDVADDPELNCGDATRKRKMVRVRSELAVPMSFLSLVGVPDIMVSSKAVAEAASVDVVLVIDISESMTWEAASNELKDPSVCNNLDPYGYEDGYPGECQPFEEVKKAAALFVAQILDKDPEEEEDRIAIVTFANGWDNNPNAGTHYRTGWDYDKGEPMWTSDRGYALDVVRNLKVIEPGPCFTKDAHGNLIEATPYGPCRDYDEDDNYLGLNCISCWMGTPYDYDDDDLSPLATTNIGGGLIKAGNMFKYNSREDSLWVVVLLTDGMANATDLTPEDDITDPSTYPIGACPQHTWDDFPLCQDKNVTTVHQKGHPNFDADDYARMAALFVGCQPNLPEDQKPDACKDMEGQGAVIFTIGLGEAVLNSSGEVGGRPYGASLLRYIAAVGYDGDPSSDPCQSEPNYSKDCGNYYYRQEGHQLSQVFEDIASRIFTRITH